MDDLQSQLQSSLGSAYILERELGGGGMSRVFVAHESGLGRKVVIKVLAPELAAGISAERFEREIRIVASLQQANIVPLLVAGRAGGASYFTMPLVEGRSLRDRLAAERSLPIAEAINILRDVARALAFAHERGVVHRDIKPDNVLLSGGAAMVSDFGIAKALSAARTDGGFTTTITHAGTGIGTPAYMAPEQAAGDPLTDHRADIYAFGCLGYEVLTGKPPFAGPSVHQIFAAHFQETPRPVTERRADVPAALSVLIARCLEKDPSRRPQAATELLLALDGASTPVPAVATDARRVARRPAFALGVALLAATLAVVSGVYLIRRDGAPASNTSASGQPVLLAVLPFINVGGDSAQAYLADGIGEELATTLGKVPGVRVVGRTAAYQYRGQRGLDARRVARALGARYLVQGTLRQTGGHLSVNAQLSDSTNGAELWADVFDRDSKDLAAVQDDIARAIGDTLRVRLGVALAGPSRRGSNGTKNAEAYDLYLRGRDHVRRRGPGVKQAVANFERAIALDPSFAQAYAALAGALELIPFFVGTPPAEVYTAATTAARHALALDSTLAEPHSALAAAYWYAGVRADSTAAEFRLALGIEPNNPEIHVLHGRYLLVSGRTSDAIAEFTRAKDLDPVSPVASAWLAYAMYTAGRRAEGLAEITRALQIDASILPAANFGELLNLAEGHPDVARHLADGADPGSMSYAAYVYAMLGDSARAVRMVAAMEARQPRPWFADAERASVMLALGDTAAALTAFERSDSTSGGMWTQVIPVTDRAYDRIRGSARFAKLLRGAGLDERVFVRR